MDFKVVKGRYTIEYTTVVDGRQAIVKTMVDNMFEMETLVSMLCTRNGYQLLNVTFE